MNERANSSLCRNYYQVGGSLSLSSPTYLSRASDDELYLALKQNKICYILNARQMGKSSLWVKTAFRLEADNYICRSVDLSSIGTQTIDLEQWFASLVFQISCQFDLNFDFLEWWQSKNHLTVSYRLLCFFEEILLEQIQQPIVIAIDEIDSVLALSFNTDDFFALVRSCFHFRHSVPKFKRLTFVMIGVAVPSDLIKDNRLTPFNIGHAIELENFKLHEAQNLLPGLRQYIDRPESILKRILFWTNGQPFLTQKICAIAQKKLSKNRDTLATAVMDLRQWTDNLVYQHCIKDWQNKDEPEHLRNIRSRLLYSVSDKGYALIAIRQLHQKDYIDVDDSIEQMRLLLSGLVVKQERGIYFRNRIYRAVFSFRWVELELSKLRPYAQSLCAWQESNFKDESRLLQGQALKEALAWSETHQMGGIDYRFLSASRDYAQKIELQRLESERAQALEAKWEEEQKRQKEELRAGQLRRMIFRVIVGALITSSALCLVSLYAFIQSQKAQIRLLATSAEALFSANRQLDALIKAIQAKRTLNDFILDDKDLRQQVDQTLESITLQMQEVNRLTAHSHVIWCVDWRPNTKEFVTGSRDRSLKIWNESGQLLQNIPVKTEVYAAKFSPDGTMLVATTSDHVISIWKAEETGRFPTKPTLQLRGHQGPVWSIAFTADSQYLLSTSSDQTIRVWSQSGQLRQIHDVHQAPVMGINIHPDGKWVLTSDGAGKIYRWNLNEKAELSQIPVTEYKGHQDRVSRAKFSPDGQYIVSVSDDRTSRIWQLDGTLSQTLRGHDATVWALAFSPDSQWFATGSWDGHIRLWDRYGNYVNAFNGHEGRIRDLTFSPDGALLVSTSLDASIRLWKTKNLPLLRFGAHDNVVLATDVHPNKPMFATSGDDHRIRLWNWDGHQLSQVNAHTGGVLDLDFSDTGEILASASWDARIGVWPIACEGGVCQIRQGKYLTHHTEPAWGVAISPDGDWLASGSEDKTIGIQSLRDPDQPATFLRGHTREVRRLAFSPDSQTLASGSFDASIRLWERHPQGHFLPTAKHILQGHEDFVDRLAFSPDGQTLGSSSSDGTIQLWSKGETQPQSIFRNEQHLNTLAFSPDGQLIATDSGNGDILILNRSGHMLRRLFGHRAKVWDLAFSLDQQKLISVSEDKYIIIWDLNMIL